MREKNKVTCHNTSFSKWKKKLSTAIIDIFKFIISHKYLKTDVVYFIFKNISVFRKLSLFMWRTPIIFSLKAYLLKTRKMEPPYNIKMVFFVFGSMLFSLYLSISSVIGVFGAPKCLSRAAAISKCEGKYNCHSIVVLTFMKTRDGTFLFVFLWSFNNKGFQPTLQLSFVNVAYSLQLVALWIGMAISTRPHENDFHECLSCRNIPKLRSKQQYLCNATMLWTFILFIEHRIS